MPFDQGECCLTKVCCYYFYSNSIFHIARWWYLWGPLQHHWCILVVLSMLKPQQTVVNIYFICEWITVSHSWIITCESYGDRFNFKGREIRFDILGQIMIFCGFLLFLNVKQFLFSWTAPSHNIRTLWQAILFVYPIFSTHHFMLFWFNFDD